MGQPKVSQKSSPTFGSTLSPTLSPTFRTAGFILGVGGVVGMVGMVINPAVNPVMAQPIPGESRMVAQSSAISGTWRLVVMGEPTSPMVVPQDTELTADFAENRISGSGGCNRFMGGYQTQANQLKIEPLASTFMACEEPVMNQEMRYLKALQAAQRYEVDSQGQLTIFYQTEQESGVLRFVAQSVRGLW